MERQKIKKLLLNFAKIGISLAMLYFVFRKIPFKEISALWLKINPLWLLPASMLFLFSQIISTVRLGKFFHAAGFNISFKSNLQLYFLGMFYNFFIPGGIGGDAYKIYLLNRKFGWNAKKLTGVLFNDRLNGLIAIILIIFLLVLFLIKEGRIFVLLMLFAAIVGLIIFVKKFIPTFNEIYWKSLALSFGVQILQISCFVILLKAVGVTGGFAVYSLLFLASSVLSLISFAGIGVREMLFVLASKSFDFSPELSVSASLLFTAITAFFSFFGLFFEIRKVNLTLTETK